MASTAPSLDLGLPLARPLKAARAASMASRGSDLPARRRFWRSGRSTSRTSTPTRLQVAGQARAIGPRALHADLGDVAEGSEPAEQRLVARSIGLEALRAEQTSEWIESRCHMNVEVRVDATSHTTRSFYDGHGHPFSLFGVRDGTAVPDRSDGRSQVVGSNPDQSPQLGDGTCRCQCAAGGSRPTTSCNVTGLQVRPNPPALPKLFGTSNQAVDPQRSINELGQVRVFLCW